MSRPARSAETRIRSYDSAGLAEAAALIAAGEPVAVPTETVYGLAADATNDLAVARIYDAKGRPSFNPLIVHVSDLAMARRLVSFNATAERLAAAFWPGALTMVLPRLPDCPVAGLASAGLPTLAVRLPSHPAMRALISAAGVPLAAPSANRSGGISPTRAAHVLASLGGRIPFILDAGPARDGLESTIVRPLDDAIILLRPGPVTPAQLETATGLPVRDPEAGAGITAPGQLESHYAPSKPLMLNCDVPAPGAFHIGFGPGPCQRNLSVGGDLVEAAANLFALLHEADESAATRISIAPIPRTGLGLAINDRLRRAAA
ncbi:MAG: threonylcarbamoyl-AMP synthase [Alphaproteobacteria bacterium]|nr:threonylcarbamoyl-AMP synthase [Alphaproteobacteria bacterium]MBU0795456.1 threonylcarbamoyl-AMP synthase [Alphaproteobacteria bacterium]MBU0875742.1 threonylcarbamoyl-AMP synthase [Alphaproteobacteria bacterium]MBU1769067.1 threonylcarbamoyl-AMP synthase [Alphaproteobacteria bacterium]